MMSATNVLSNELTDAILRKNIATALSLIDSSKSKDSSVDINQSDGSEDDLTPLMLACIQQLFDIVTALLDHPSIEINVQNKDGITPLMFAAGSGNTAIVTKLLSHKSINISLQDNEGHTALWWGENSKNNEVITLLQSHSRWCHLI